MASPEEATILTRLADAMWGNHGEGVLARLAIVGERTKATHELIEQISLRFSAVETFVSTSESDLPMSERRILIAAVRGHLDDEDAHISREERDSMRHAGRLASVVGGFTGRTVASVLQTVLMAAIFAWLVTHGVAIPSSGVGP